MHYIYILCICARMAQFQCLICHLYRCTSNVFCRQQAVHVSRPCRVVVNVQAIVDHRDLKIQDPQADFDMTTAGTQPSLSEILFIYAWFGIAFFQRIRLTQILQETLFLLQANR